MNTYYDQRVEFWTKMVITIVSNMSSCIVVVMCKCNSNRQGYSILLNTIATRHYII